MQDLSSDIIGTNPTYPKIVNHDWLTPDPRTYDNYPSDNNPVRVVPKLADLWNHENTGINLIPNMTVQQLGLRNSSEEKTERTSEVIREAKKAMMSGLSGRALAEHLRARFISHDIVAAKDSLTKLAEEQGLLGNVYIDASAFASAREAEQFMAQHRNRLAQDILLNESKLTPGAISVLASKFRKNVISKVAYDQNTFDKYRNHLVVRGDLPSDFVVNSKETLRQAFLYEREIEKEAVGKPEEEINKEAALKVMTEDASRKASQNKEATDDLLFRKVQPILEFTRSQVVKGKDASALKEMLYKRFATEDIKDSLKFMGLVVAELNNKGIFTPEVIQAKMDSGELSEYAGGNLKKMAKKYPMVNQIYTMEDKAAKYVGVKGTFHTPLSPVVAKDLGEYNQTAMEALRKGTDLDVVKANLLSKLSSEDTDMVLANAVSAFNNAPVGIVANAPEKKAKEVIVADLPERETLPDAATTASQIKEIESFYEGSGGMEVSVNASFKPETVEVSGLESKSGMDSAV